MSRVWPAKIAVSPTMIMMLKTAEPTIAPRPSSPGWMSVETIACHRIATLSGLHAVGIVYWRGGLRGCPAAGDARAPSPARGPRSLPPGTTRPPRRGELERGGDTLESLNKVVVADDRDAQEHVEDAEEVNREAPIHVESVHSTELDVARACLVRCREQPPAGALRAVSRNCACSAGEAGRAASSEEGEGADDVGHAAPPGRTRPRKGTEFRHRVAAEAQSLTVLQQLRIVFEENLVVLGKIIVFFVLALRLAATRNIFRRIPSVGHADRRTELLF